MDKTAVKVFRAFELICLDDKPVGVSVLATRLGVTKSNAHRILSTLVGLGYVQQLESGEYKPTLRAWEIGSVLIGRLDFVQVAKPYLRQLNEETGESIYLAALSGASVVYLDVLDSSYPIRINAAIGGSAPPHCSASGKLLLAYNPLFAKQYLTRPLEKHTARTATKLSEVRKILETTRRNGFAVNDGEWREGVCGVSAPLHTAYREGVAAIGITALKERTNRRKLMDFAAVLKDTASLISRELGYRPPGQSRPALLPPSRTGAS